MPRELFDYGLVETNSQYDTYRGSSWELELEGIGISKETMLMACKTASLPTLAVGKENAFHMNDRVQVAGVPEHPDLIGEVDKLIAEVAAVEEKYKIATDLLKLRDFTKDES